MEVELLKQILYELRQIREVQQKALSRRETPVTYTTGTFTLGNGRTFTLNVETGGTIVGLDPDGGDINRNFAAGYHPVQFSSITEAGTTATGITALEGR